MAKREMYSIEDKKAEEFAPPFIAKNDAVALRAYSSAIKDVSVKNDYALWCIGTFDDENAEIYGVGRRLVEFPEEI